MPRKRGTKPGTSYKGGHQFDFGQRLYALRKKKGLSQPELAQKMSTTVRAISYYEREMESPDAGLLKQLSKALGVSLKAFFDKQYADKVEAVPEVIRPLKKRLTKLPTLTRKEQENLIGVIDGFLAKHAQGTP